MTEAFELVSNIEQAVIPNVIAFALARKVVKILVKAIFKGRLEL